MTCDHTIGQKMFGTGLTTVDTKEHQTIVYQLTEEQVCLLEFIKNNYRFEYCPHCGTKVDWADIRRKFKEEQEI